jgi:hypothetical protein
MQINLKISYADGTEKEVTAIAADLVAFETKFDLSIAKLDKEVKLTHLLYLAWSVEHRNADTKADFEQWLLSVNSVAAADPKK